MKFRNIALCALCALTVVGCKKDAPAGEDKKADAPITGDKVASVGREHLPEGCELVVSLDWPRFRDMKSVKGTIDQELAKFEAPPVPNAPIDPETAADIKKAKEFLQKTQIDLRKDPGELAFCSWKMAQAQGNAPPAFVFALGGRFIPGAAVEAFDTLSERFKALLSRARPGADKKAPPEIIEVAGVKTAYDKAEGVYMAQAKDGAFIVSNDRAAFEKSLGTSKAHEAYKLPKEPLGLAFTQAAASLLAPQLAQSPLAPAAGAFAGANLGYSEGQIRLQIELTDAAVMPALRSNLDMFIKPNPAMPPHPLTEALSRARVTSEGTVLTLEVPLPEEMTQGLLQQAGVGAPQPRPLVVRPGGPQGQMPQGQMPAGMPPGPGPKGAPASAQAPAPKP